MQPLINITGRMKNIGAARQRLSSTSWAALVEACLWIAERLETRCGLRRILAIFAWHVSR